jgi:hypothetical protein
MHAADLRARALTEPITPSTEIVEVVTDESSSSTISVDPSGVPVQVESLEERPPALIDADEASDDEDAEETVKERKKRHKKEKKERNLLRLNPGSRAKSATKVEEVDFKGNKVPILIGQPLTSKQKKNVARNEYRRAISTKVPISKLQPTKDRTGKWPLKQWEDERRTLRQNRLFDDGKATEIRANALQTASLTGRSVYLRNILLPDEGAISIPDDVLRPHFAKSETVTANLLVPSSGSGLFVFYPEHPTNLIGYHYIKTPAGYVFDSVIQTAQDLKDSYDYAKRGSCLVTARSSTVPSGQFALNGTFNVVRVEGFLTEVPGLNDPDLYNTILTNTVEPLDKVGNVLVGDGVAILGMTGAFGQPYTRLGDVTPYEIRTGVYALNAPHIIDRSQDLEYSSLASYEEPMLAGVPTLIFDSNMNIDSTTGVEFQVVVMGNTVVDGLYSNFVQLDFLDPFGNLLLHYEANEDQETDAAHAYTTSFQQFISIPLVGLGPLGSVRLQVTVTSPEDNPTPVLFVAQSYKVPNGARTGVCGPIVLAAYAGAAEASVITVSGWANFNLIPNPSLRQNLELTYGQYDADDIAWCRTVLAHRRTFELRSVYNLRDYLMSREYLAELADTTVHKRAMALSGSDIIAKLKSWFLPALKAAGSAGLGTLLGVAASGSAVRSRAASGDIIKPHPLNMLGNSVLSVPFSIRSDTSARAMCAERSTQRYVSAVMEKQKRRVIKQRFHRIVVFPVIVQHPQIKGNLDVMLYAVSNVDYARFRPENKARSPSGWFVQGTDTQSSIPLTCSLYMFPIDPQKFPEVRVIPGPLASGHSCEGAMWLVMHGKFSGMLPFAVTGAVLGNELQPVDLDIIEEKLKFCRSVRIPLAANSQEVDMPIEDLVDIQVSEQKRFYKAY